MKNAAKTKTNLSERDEDICVDIFRNIMRARHLLHEMASTVATRSGLHAAEMNVVDILGKFGAISMGDLSRKTFISPSNTTSTVKKLEAADLVKRNRSYESGREVTVSLTTNGKALFRSCYPQILGEAHAHMVERLSRQERKNLAAILKKFVL
jgi:DNA-binding MarR family transcriptional regulator